MEACSLSLFLYSSLDGGKKNIYLPFSTLQSSPAFLPSQVMAKRGSMRDAINFLKWGISTSLLTAVYNASTPFFASPSFFLKNFKNCNFRLYEV